MEEEKERKKERKRRRQKRKRDALFLAWGCAHASDVTRRTLAVLPAMNALVFKPRREERKRRERAERKGKGEAS